MTDLEASFFLYETYLKRITYKPGYTFTVRHNFSGLAIEIVAILTDVRDHSRVAPVTSLLCVYPDMEFEEFCRFLVSAVREREIHETHEWFRVDGEQFINPHLPLLPLSRLSSTAL